MLITLRHICKKILILLVSLMFGIVVLTSGCKYCKLESNSIQKLPDYYFSYTDSKVGQINFIKSERNIDKSFYFVTDLHWESNTKNSPILIDYISERCSIKNVVLGGDYLFHDYESKESALSVMRDCVSAFKAENCVAMLGNHENNITNGNKTEYVSDEESFAVLNDGKYENTYFVDLDEELKICSIYLNTNNFHYEAEQYKWLEEQLCSLAKDYFVFIFMHIYMNGTFGEVYIERQGIVIDALLNANRDKIKCTVGAIFSGHIHSDNVIYNDYGCPVITTASDGIGVYAQCCNDYYRESNTITEQAFDVVQIDLSNRKIYMTRIGAGNDRVVTF